MTLEEKLSAFEQWAPAAMSMICDLIEETPEDLHDLARERHIWGHEQYEDRNLMEWDDDTLFDNFLEELADAIVYAAHWLDRKAMSGNHEQVRWNTGTEQGERTT